MNQLWKTTILLGVSLTAGCALFESEQKDRVAQGKPTVAIDREAPSDEEVARIYVEKGVQYLEAGQYGLARKDLMKAVELDGENGDAYNALGVLYQKLDDKSQAEASFRRALSLSSNNDAVRNNYGRYLCSVGRSEEALALFSAIVAGKLYPQPWIPLTNAGFCAGSMGGKGEAEAYYRQALQLKPDFPPPLLEMAKLALAQGRPSEAQDYLQRYDKVVEGTAESLALDAEIESALGNRQAATGKYQTLRSRFPDSSELMRVRQKLGL